MLVLWLAFVQKRRYNGSIIKVKSHYMLRGGEKDCYRGTLRTIQCRKIRTVSSFEFVYWVSYCLDCMNKDLVLREYLAIERTRLANETTLLAYIRTGLYFLVAGSTLGEVIKSSFWQIVGIPLVVIGLLIMLWGAIRYFRLRKAIDASKKNIGNSSAAFIKSVVGQ